ncbi:MAG: hypothetical protein HND48_20395 [Chloroflexi bacterium]|nr:hypothetical protein [Chloroflexota bacterium]
MALSTLTTPALLLLPDTASAYSVAAAVPKLACRWPCCCAKVIRAVSLMPCRHWTPA